MCIADLFSFKFHQWVSILTCVLLVFCSNIYELQVKITAVNPRYTCGLNVISFRMAISKSGDCNLTYRRCKTLIVQMLRYNPTVPANPLSPFLEKYITQFQHVNSKFMCNFYDKVNKYNELRITQTIKVNNGGCTCAYWCQCCYGGCGWRQLIISDTCLRL